MYLLITIDTEEEFYWDHPFSSHNHSVHNIHAHHNAMMPFFIQHNIKPMMVVSYPVVSDENSCGLLRDMFEKEHIDVGAHLHPWVNPPYQEELSSFSSYAGNLPYELEYQKLLQLTDIIHDKFNYRPITYKAGRYGIGRNTNKILAELGYKYDLSYFAGRSFIADGGPDHRHIQSHPFTDDQGIQHFPMTTIYTGIAKQCSLLRWAVQKEYVASFPLRGMLSKLNLCAMTSLTPENTCLEEMKKITHEGIKQGTQIFQMSYHSSIFTERYISYIQSKDDIQNLEKRIKDYILFFQSQGGMVGNLFNVVNSIS